MRRKAIGSATAVFLLLAANHAAAATIRLPSEGKVSRVVDGDTVRVRADGKEHAVRLIGIDAPESAPSAKLDGDAKRLGESRDVILARGRMVTEFLRRVCHDKPCGLGYDPANEQKGHLDAYGRLLAYLWVKDRKGLPRLINAVLLRAGGARADADRPFDARLCKAFQRYEEEARTHGRGIWRRGRPAAPKAPAPDPAAQVGNRNSKVFHTPDCHSAARMSLGNLVYFPDAEAARAAGYRPCKICHPQ